MQLDKQSSRDVLLTSALDAFGQHGFNSATTRDIASAANMPMSQITYHFGGKEGLYRACARMIADQMSARVGDTLAAVEVALAETPDPQTARHCLRLLLTGLSAAILDPAALPISRFVLREQADPTPAFAILYDGVMGRVLGALAAAIGLVSGKSGAEARVLAIALFGQLLVFRVAQASVLAFTGWVTVGEDQLRAIRDTLLFNIDAICDCLEKGQTP